MDRDLLNLLSENFNHEELIEILEAAWDSFDTASFSANREDAEERAMIIFYNDLVRKIIKTLRAYYS